IRRESIRTQGALLPRKDEPAEGVGIAVAYDLRNSGAIPSTERGMTKPSITLIGGGLVGALLGTLLARRGYRVDLFEKRTDPRRAGFAGGRSINLALAERGLHALRQADLADEVLEHAVMMRGRMVHPREGASGLQRYGVDDSEVIWSVARGGLNVLLLDAAEAAGVQLHFGQSLASADFDARRIRVIDDHGIHREVEAGVLIGADGAGSALRAAMDARLRGGYRGHRLPGYV
ncbi:putative Kynurenine 3-monooxygenase, siderophore biosynthesis, partial [Rhodanobacter sp. 115]